MRGVVAGLAALTFLAPVAISMPAAAQTASQIYAPDQFDKMREKAGVTNQRQRDPIERKHYDEAVSRLFGAADSNRDGMVTVAEVQAIIGARAEEAVSARFAQIDANRDKSLSYAEFSAWQRGLGTAALSESQARAASGLVAAEIRAEPGRGREGEIVADLIQPLSSTVVAAANTNYDAGMSLSELIAYEGKRFDALDANKDGWLIDDELRTRTADAGGAPPRG